MPHIEEIQTEPQESQPEVAESERRDRIRLRNRRKIYLDRHPSYFTSPDLELADPLLYDRCVRRFQSAAEREADGKSKGYSGVLEADLYRSEAKLSALKRETLGGELRAPTSPQDSIVNYVRDENGEVMPEDPDEIPISKEDGFERWKYEMSMRFLKGDDEDFNYQEVDESDEWDIIEGKEEEEKWFDEEEPEWAELGDGKAADGETGIQDF